MFIWTGLFPSLLPFSIWGILYVSVREKFYPPDAILLSWAAGPSLSTFFTCRNSSVRSPPMMVNPNPWELFFSAVWYISPLSWLGSEVKPDALPLPAHKGYRTANVWRKNRRCNGRLQREVFCWGKSSAREKLYQTEVKSPSGAQHQTR